MISRKFLEIAGYLRTADKWRPKVNAMVARKPLILGIVWTVTVLIISGVIIGMIVPSQSSSASSVPVSFPGLEIGFTLLIIGAVWSLWSGPFGLETKIYEEERRVLICYKDSYRCFEKLPPDQRMVLFGLQSLKSGTLELTGQPKILTQDMLTRSSIGKDLRFPLGPYTYLGIAFMGPFGEPEVSHEDLMAQLWIKDALKAGLSESDIHNFTRNLDVAS